MTREPLNVFITVDTEVWPYTSDWRSTRLAEEHRRYIDGATPRGGFGIPYQVETLSKHGLKGTFFVEGLYACEIGLEPLRRTVSLVQDSGHEVDLHVHTEWLRRMTVSILPGRQGQHIKDFTVDEQGLLLRTALDNLYAAGAKPIRAYRAGNFGAGFDTLRALESVGIEFDTSHNAAFLGTACALDTGEPLRQPARIGAVWELPVTCYEDYPRHERPLQICASSLSEMRHVLEQAWVRRWNAVVIVSHSFEFLKRRTAPGRLAEPDRIAIGRFEGLCAFLAAHRDRFRTTGFADLDVSKFPAHQPREPLRSSMPRTARRMVEQALSQLL